MKRNARLLSVLLGGLSVIALNGCSGGGGSAETKKVEGLLVDGYLKGATVFIDKNGNKQLDSDEVSAVTGAGGKFELVLPKDSTDDSFFPVIAHVTTSTVNEDDGKPVSKEYYLSAPAGKPQVISPITTMIQNKIETGSSEAAAVTAVKTALGGLNVDLYKDFVTESKSTTSTEKAAYIKIYNAAQVVAARLADNLEVIKANAETTSKINELLSTAVQRITTQLAAISELPEVKAASVMSPSSVATLLSTSTVVPTIAPTSVKTAVATQLEHMAPIALATSFKDAITNGIYWGDSDSYGVVKLASDGVSLTQEMHYFDYKTKTWTTTRPADWSTETDYVLTNSGWKITPDDGTEGKVSFKGDGTVDWTNTIDGSSMNLRMLAYDISGKTVSSYYSGYSSTPSTSTDVFPADSKAYKMIRTQLKDTYSLTLATNKNYDGSIVEFNKVETYVNNVSTPAKTLDDLLTMFSDKSTNGGFHLEGIYSNGSSDISAKFAGTNVVNFYEYNYQTQGAQLIGTSTWEDKSIGGQTLRIINLPDALKTKYEVNELTFFVVKDGYVRQGEYIKAGSIDSESDHNLNKTAFDVMKIYIDKILLSAPKATAKAVAKTFNKHFFGM